MLYGRASEQAAIEELVEAARGGRSGALVLRGEPGIGKSALLDWAAEHCAGGGVRVLRVAGIETEADLAFAGLVQLLWPVKDHLEALPAAQADALRAVLGSGGAAGQDRFLSGLAVMMLLARLADDGPVLCLADDAHWLDHATADALLFAARRLTQEKVAMVFAAREEGFAAPGLPELRPSRLSQQDAERVLAHRGLTPAAREQVIAESEGNPLALIEFSRERRRYHAAAGPVPIADRVLASFRSRIALLPDRTRLMMLMAAAEGRGDLPLLLSAADALGVGPEDLAQAEQAGLVEVSAAAIAFRHPLIRTAAYQSAPLARRITAHRALADAATDDDCRVRHRAAAATSPDEDLAVELTRAAERAHDRTAFAAAAGLWEQAALFTPHPRDRAARLGRAAALALSSGQADHADRLLGQAEALLDDPACLATLTETRAVVEFERGAGRVAARLLVERSAAAEPGRVVPMLRTAAGYAWVCGEAEVIRSAAARLAGLGVRDPMIQGLAHLVDDDYARGLPLLGRFVAQALPLLGQFVAQALPLATGQAPHSLPHVSGQAPLAAGQAPHMLPDAAGQGTHMLPDAAGQGTHMLPDAAGQMPHALPEGAALQWAAFCAMILSDDGAAAALAGAEVARFRRQSLVGALPQLLQDLAGVQVQAGRHRDAEASIEEAVQLARDTGMHQRVPRLHSVLARVAAIEGDERRCVRLASDQPDAGGMTGLAALCLLDLGLGRYDRVLERLEAAARGPLRHLTVLVTAGADQVEAAVRLGEPERAEAPLRRLEAWARAGGQPWAEAVSARCRGLLSDDEDDYLRALAAHQHADRPFEQARTELVYGEWLRRSGRRADARAPLRAALGTFERLRAAPWRSRAEAELKATGESVLPARPAAADPLERLTPQELQVVRLAKDGSTSREIAAHLFLSPRTVEHHLYRAYRKLGIRSRRELARLDLA
ncbi:helix-turn-helix transcriptional regulator [Nonomuraea gerenzanensis]|uniref:Putative transcriptional regulator n=1 Tax=Nonomuraea gerenzanensis TaxID=93944 RepID=A0A1M4EIM9_9ACTN|nr:LuxR family transcriptional regulator [Nonomuraea gerenzanensis]UBU10286.1 AAA family ATPase [Nonomuraea gerenzanensis]SBO98670.1 putative transcriptional regulator [Nonomuraea gerenzanensis]